MAKTMAQDVAYVKGLISENYQAINDYGAIVEEVRSKWGDAAADSVSKHWQDLAK